MKDEETLELIDMCDSQKYMSNAFLHEGRTAPELSILLTTDIYLNYISRFCSKTKCYGVFGVNPTFNICTYNVTVSTYKHPLPKVRESETNPVLIGLVLIHSAKIFASYFTLPRIMIRLKLELAALKVIGTDGEDNLSRSLIASF